MQTNPTSLGIIAGGGDLPRQLCIACQQKSRPYFLVILDGQGDPNLLDDHPGVVIRLGAVGKIASTFKKADVTDLVLAGKVARPSVTQMRPDSEALKFFATVGKSAFGDDALLKAVIGHIETRFGFRVVSVADVLGEQGVQPGIMGTVEPDDQARADINRGLMILKAMGPVDVGQAVVVQQGLVLGVEAIEGTDALLKRCSGLRRDGAGGVLVKIAKPGQEERADLPTIGVDTLENAASAGLRGIAIEAQRTIVLDQGAITETADRLGLFVEAIEISSESPPS
jgi:hypothetical protein